MVRAGEGAREERERGGEGEEGVAKKFGVGAVGWVAVAVAVAVACRSVGVELRVAEGECRLCSQFPDVI